MHINSLVSIIIPTKNSVKTIEVCLRSVKKQAYPNIEIIIVDNYSIDRTREIAKKYHAEILLKKSERSAGRNYGAKRSTGSYLLFIDSDMELTRNVVKECVEIVQRENAHAVIIPEISVGQGFWAKCKALEKMCYIGDETIEAARFFTKEIFRKFKGYDEKLIGGEDWDLPFRIKKAGFKISRIRSIIKHHEGKLSLLKSMKKKYYYAQTVTKYIKKHPDIAQQQFKLIRPAFIRNWKNLIKRPIYASGMVLMKICEFGAGGLGYLRKDKNVKV